MRRAFGDGGSNSPVVDEILQQLSARHGDLDDRLSFLLTNGVTVRAGWAGRVIGNVEEEWNGRSDWEETTLRRTAQEPMEPSDVVPPAVVSESVLYYHMLFSSRTRVPSEKIGEVFVALLEDPLWFNHVEQLPLSSLTKSLRDAAMDWWADHAKPALQSAADPYLTHTDSETVTPAASANEPRPQVSAHDDDTNACASPLGAAHSTTKPPPPATAATPLDVRASLPERWLGEMRGMLTTFVTLAAPYRAMRPTFAPMMYCSERVMMCGDPMVLYLSLLINILPTSTRILAKNMPALHAITYGWGSSVTFADILEARWQQYLALKAVFIEKYSALHARRTEQRADTHGNEEHEPVSGASAAVSPPAQQTAKSTSTSARLQGHLLQPAFLLPEDTIPSNGRRFTSRRTSHVDPRVSASPPPQSSRGGATNSAEEAAQQARFILEVVLASMRRDVGDVGSCLWWARCRILASLLLNSETMDEVVSSPAMPFFRHLAEVGPVAARILADRAPWLQQPEKECSAATSATTSSPHTTAAAVGASSTSPNQRRAATATSSRETTKQVTSLEEMAAAKAVCGQYGAATAAALTDILLRVSANEDEEDDAACAVLSDWSAEDRTALQELRQLRGELSEMYGELVGAIADVSYFYQTVNKTAGNTPTSLRAALGETGASGIWSTIHSAVPSNPRFKRACFTSYREFWQYQLLIDHHITYMYSLEVARACQLVVPQLVGTLQKYPDYYPTLILKTLMSTHRRDVVPAAVRAGLASATVAVLRHHLPLLTAAHPPGSTHLHRDTVGADQETRAFASTSSSASPGSSPAFSSDLTNDNSMTQAEGEAAAVQVQHRSEDELRAQTRNGAHMDLPLSMSTYSAVLFSLRTVKTLVKFGTHASVNPITLLLSPPTPAAATEVNGAESAAANTVDPESRAAAQAEETRLPETPPGLLDPKQHDLCTVLLALAQQTRYGFLSGAVLRLLAACVHSNVRDMVPALLERGVAQIVLDKLARPLHEEDYRPYTASEAHQWVEPSLAGLLGTARRPSCTASPASVVQDADTAIPSSPTSSMPLKLARCMLAFLPQEPIALRMHAPRMACAALIQALTIHQVTHTIFLTSTASWMPAIVESIRGCSRAIRVVPRRETTGRPTANRASTEAEDAVFSDPEGSDGDGEAGRQVNASPDDRAPRMTSPCSLRARLHDYETRIGRLCFCQSSWTRAADAKSQTAQSVPAPSASTTSSSDKADLYLFHFGATWTYLTPWVSSIAKDVFQLFEESAAVREQLGAAIRGSLIHLQSAVSQSPPRSTSTAALQGWLRHASSEPSTAVGNLDDMTELFAGFAGFVIVLSRFLSSRELQRRFGSRRTGMTAQAQAMIESLAAPLTLPLLYLFYFAIPCRTLPPRAQSAPVQDQPLTSEDGVAQQDAARREDAHAAVNDVLLDTILAIQSVNLSALSSVLGSASDVVGKEVKTILNVCFANLQHALQESSKPRTSASQDEERTSVPQDTDINREGSTDSNTPRPLSVLPIPCRFPMASPLQVETASRGALTMAEDALLAMLLSCIYSNRNYSGRVDEEFRAWLADTMMRIFLQLSPPRDQFPSFSAVAARRRPPSASAFAAQQRTMTRARAIALQLQRDAPTTTPSAEAVPSTDEDAEMPLFPGVEDSVLRVTRLTGDLWLRAPRADVAVSMLNANSTTPAAHGRPGTVTLLAQQVRIGARVVRATAASMRMEASSHRDSEQGSDEEGGREVSGAAHFSPADGADDRAVAREEAALPPSLTCLSENFYCSMCRLLYAYTGERHHSALSLSVSLGAPSDVMYRTQAFERSPLHLHATLVIEEVISPLKRVRHFTQQYLKAHLGIQWCVLDQVNASSRSPEDMLPLLDALDRSLDLEQAVRTLSAIDYSNAARAVSMSDPTQTRIAAILLEVELITRMVYTCDFSESLPHVGDTTASSPQSAAPPAASIPSAAAAAAALQQRIGLCLAQIIVSLLFITPVIRIPRSGAPMGSIRMDAYHLVAQLLSLTLDVLPSIRGFPRVAAIQSGVMLHLKEIAQEKSLAALTRGASGAFDPNSLRRSNSFSGVDPRVSTRSSDDNTDVSARHHATSTTGVLSTAEEFAAGEVDYQLSVPSAVYITADQRNRAVLAQSALTMSTPVPMTTTGNTSSTARDDHSHRLHTMRGWGVPHSHRTASAFVSGGGVEGVTPSARQNPYAGAGTWAELEEFRRTFELQGLVPDDAAEDDDAVGEEEGGEEGGEGDETDGSDVSEPREGDDDMSGDDFDAGEMEGRFLESLRSLFAGAEHFDPFWRRLHSPGNVDPSNGDEGDGHPDGEDDGRAEDTAPSVSVEPIRTSGGTFGVRSMIHRMQARYRTASGAPAGSASAPPSVAIPAEKIFLGHVFSWVCDLACGAVVPLHELSAQDQKEHRHGLARVLWSCWQAVPAAEWGGMLVSMVRRVLTDPVRCHPLLEYVGLLLSQRTMNRLRLALARTVLVTAVTERVLNAVDALKPKPILDEAASTHAETPSQEQQLRATATDVTTHAPERPDAPAHQPRPPTPPLGAPAAPQARVTRKRMLAALYNFVLLFQDNDVAGSSEYPARSNERCHHYFAGFCWNGRLCSALHEPEASSSLKTLRAAAAEGGLGGLKETDDVLGLDVEENSAYLDTERDAYESILLGLEACGYPSPELLLPPTSEQKEEDENATAGDGESDTNDNTNSTAASGLRTHPAERPDPPNERMRPTFYFASGQALPRRPTDGRTRRWRFRVALPYDDVRSLEYPAPATSTHDTTTTPATTGTERAQAPSEVDTHKARAPSLATLFGAALTPHELLLGADVCQPLLVSVLDLICDASEDGVSSSCENGDKSVEAKCTDPPVPLIYQPQWRAEDGTILVQETGSLAEMVSQLLRSLLSTSRHACARAILQHRHGRPLSDVRTGEQAMTTSAPSPCTGARKTMVVEAVHRRHIPPSPFSTTGAPAATSHTGPVLEETALPLVIAYLLQTALCTGRSCGDSRFRAPASTPTGSANNADQRPFQNQVSGVAAVDALCLLVSDVQKEEQILHRHMLAAVHTIAQHAPIGLLPCDTRDAFMRRHGLETATTEAGHAHTSAPHQRRSHTPGHPANTVPATASASASAHPSSAAGSARTRTSHGTGRRSSDAAPAGLTPVSSQVREALALSGRAVVPIVSFFASLETYRHSYVHAMRYLLEEACEIVWVQDDSPAPLIASDSPPAAESSEARTREPTDTNTLQPKRVADGSSAGTGGATTAEVETRVQGGDAREDDEARKQSLSRSWVGVWVAPKLVQRSGGSGGSKHMRPLSGRHPVVEMLFLALSAVLHSGRLSAAAATKLLDTCAEHPVLLQTLTSPNTTLSVPPELRDVVVCSAHPRATTAAVSASAKAGATTGRPNAVAASGGLSDGEDAVSSLKPIAVPAYIIIALRFRDQDHLPSSLFSALAHSTPQVFTRTLMSILWQTLKLLQHLLEGRAYSPVHLHRNQRDHGLSAEAAALSTKLGRVVCTLLHIIRKSLVLTTSTTFAAALSECYRRWGGLEALLVAGGCRCCTVPRDAATYLLLMRFFLTATSAHLKGCDPAHLTMENIEAARAELEARLEKASALDMTFFKAFDLAPSLMDEPDISSVSARTARVLTAPSDLGKAPRKDNSARAESTVSGAGTTRAAAAAGGTSSSAASLPPAPTVFSPHSDEELQSLADAIRGRSDAAHSAVFTDACLHEAIEPTGTPLTFTRPADVLLQPSGDVLGGEPRLLTPTSVTTRLLDGSGPANRAGLFHALLGADDSDSEGAEDLIVEEFEEGDDDEEDEDVEEEYDDLDDDYEEEPVPNDEDTDSGESEGEEWEEVVEEDEEGDADEEDEDVEEEYDDLDDDYEDLDLEEMLIGDPNDRDAVDYGFHPGAFWLTSPDGRDGTDAEANASGGIRGPLAGFATGQRDPSAPDRFDRFISHFSTTDDMPARSLGMLMREAGRASLPPFDSSVRTGTEANAPNNSRHTQTRHLALVCEAAITRLGPLAPDNTVHVHLHLPTLRAFEEVAPHTGSTPSSAPSPAVAPTPSNPSVPLHVTESLAEAPLFRTPSQQRIAGSGEPVSSVEAHVHASTAMSEPEVPPMAEMSTTLDTTVVAPQETPDATPALVSASTPTEASEVTGTAVAEVPAVAPPTRTVVQRILDLFAVADAPSDDAPVLSTIAARARDTGRADQALAAESAAAEAETATAPTAAPAEEEAPEEEGPQPWEGAIDPLFLEPLPEDMRSEIVFNAMDRLRGPRTYTFEGHRTRMYRRFLSALPPDVLAFVLDVETRWLRITGHSNEETAATDDGTNAEGVTHIPAGTTSILDILAVVDAETRRDVLLTCNMDDLLSVPHLLAEALEIRRAAEAEVTRAREEPARVRALRRDPTGEPLRPRQRVLQLERAAARARGEESGDGRVEDTSEEEDSVPTSEEDGSGGGGGTERGSPAVITLMRAARAARAWQPTWEPGFQAHATATSTASASDRTVQNSTPTLTPGRTINPYVVPTQASPAGSRFDRFHRERVPNTMGERARVAAAVSVMQAHMRAPLARASVVTSQTLQEAYANLEQLAPALDRARERTQQWRRETFFAPVAAATIMSTAPTARPSAPSPAAASTEQLNHRRPVGLTPHHVGLFLPAQSVTAALAAGPETTTPAADAQGNTWPMVFANVMEHGGTFGVALGTGIHSSGVRAVGATATSSSRPLATDPVAVLESGAARIFPPTAEHPYHSFAPLLPRLPEATWCYCLSLLCIGMNVDDPATSSQLRTFRTAAYSNEKTRKQVQLLLRLACSTLSETAEMLSTVLSVLEAFLKHADTEQQEAAIARSCGTTPVARAAQTDVHDILSADTSYVAVEERQASRREQELFVCSLLNIFVSLVEHNRNASLAFVMLPDEARYAEVPHPAPDPNAPLTPLEAKTVGYRLLDRITTIVSRTATVRYVVNDYATLLHHVYKTLVKVTNPDVPSTDTHHDPVARSPDDVIQTFPRHCHPLRWMDITSEHSYQVGGYVCNVCGINPGIHFCFHCATCHFDLCPSCARVKTSVEEDVVRLQRSLRCLFATPSMTDALLRMLHNPLCSEDVATTLIALYSPGLGESASVYAKAGLGQRDPVIVQVEHALIGVAQTIVAEIRQKRAHAKQYIQQLLLEKLGAEVARTAFSSSAGFGAGSYLLTLPEAFELGVDEALTAIDHLTLHENAKSMVSHLLMPYADCVRVEPRDITRMWVAAQAYLEDISLILTRCSEDAHIPLPPCVVFLMSGFCQYHLRVARLLAHSTTQASFRNGSSTLHGETERFLRETTRDPSGLSAQASEAAAQHTAVGELPDMANGGGDVPTSDAVTAALSGWVPQPLREDMGLSEGLVWPDRLSAFGLLHLNAPPPEVEEEDVATTTAAAARTAGEGGTNGGDNSAQTRRARGRLAHPPRVPRQVRTFLQNNRATLNALLHWEPRLLETSFAFLRAEPNLMDFEFKLKDFKRRLRALLTTPGASGSLSLTVRRQHVLRDSFKELRTARQTRGQLHIRFQDEEGADAGGLTREWFQLMAEELVNESYALFVHSREGLTFQPNPFSDVNPDHLSFFRFAGVVVGLAVMHNTSFDVHFTRALYRHMIGVQPVFQDLESVDPELFANLNWLLDHEVTGLGLYFVVDFDHFGVTEEAELLPGGTDMMVTDANKQQYVRLLCEFHMTRRIEPQLRELLTGFYSVIPRSEIACFSEQEVELLICGMPDIDIEDLRAHTAYESYNASSPQIRWFWEVVTSMSSTDRANLLQFVTGASKVPHGGFASLQGTGGQRQAFTISRWDTSPDLLPQAHTCFNKIDLPEYPDAATLREKLMTAITYGSMGFSMV